MGVLLEDKELIKDGIVGFYHRQMLDRDDVSGLEQPFSEEEVLVALRSLSGDKAPGPDGFSLAFFQHCWEVIKKDVTEVFHFFHAHMRFEKSFNASFITLIPKKMGASDLKDFRPISLIGSVYKIIAKVLAQRLRKVVGKIISESQHAFVRNRQILDASFIANEIVDARLRAEPKACFVNWILKRRTIM